MEDEIPERSPRRSKPEAAERKLLELASAIEANHGRAPVSEINTQFMAAGGSADEYARAVEAALDHGWLTLHSSGGYLSFTPLGAVLYA
jgi:hypothetical protein